MTQSQVGWSGHVGDALAQLEEERRKLEQLQETVATTTTTVRARDRLFTVTLDGRGEVTDLAFDGFRYRKLPPGELARLIVDTIAAGRKQAIAKLSGAMGSDPLPGISFSDIASGSVPFTQVLDSFLGVAVEQLPGNVRGRVEQRLRGES